ncbi:hypothetical protein AJ79_02372 [Helicocarpus griseus UAMH5409]|uniref:HNH nuclease domain-containing protein n=1 Tax=Helicocarpus griseus UAMH5409 TaxID=1447875 RepID=A0A2B7Y2U3_9EURO|nr:hypothetical protein AJ79_02372 [Helicocarpus griseus UAMH5409]
MGYSSQIIWSAFDKHQLVIVPDSVKTTPQEYKFLVLDKSGLWEAAASFDGSLKFRDIHGQRVRFQPGNSFRPRARYLYFKYVLATLVQLRKRNIKYGTHTIELPDIEMPELPRVWATEGKYLRKNLILAFIEGIGHELPQNDTLSLLSCAQDGINIVDSDDEDEGSEGEDYEYEDYEYEDEDDEDESHEKCN